MDIDLLPGGQPLRDEIRAYLAAHHDPTRLDDLLAGAPGYDPQLWAGIGQEGWLRFGLPGARIGDLAVLASELGRARVPTPVHGGLVQPAWAATGADPAHAVGVLAGVTEGSTRVTLCLAGPAGRIAPGSLGVRVHRAGTAVRLDGVKRYVPFADSADVLVVCADDAGGGVSLVAVPADADGLTVEPAPSVAGDRQAEVRLVDVEVGADAVIGPEGGAWDAVHHAVLVGTVALCAEAVGASAALVDQAVACATTRQVFGGPLGRLQAVQHRCADMALDQLAAMGAVDDAVACLDAGRPAGAVVAAAKVQCGTACLRIAASAHQLWGGTGYLADAGLHHWTRLIKGIDAQLGGARDQRRSLIALLGEERGWSTHALG